MHTSSNQKDVIEGFFKVFVVTVNPSTTNVPNIKKPVIDVLCKYFMK